MLYVEQFGETTKADNVEKDLLQLEINWQRYIDAGAGDNALTKALFSVFGGRFCILLLFSTLTAALSFASPFLIMFLLKWI